MNQKQKLVTALREANVGAGSYKLKDFLKDVSIERIADHLIKQGITFVSDSKSNN